MIDRPETPLALPDHALVLGRPGDTAAVETMLLIAHSITHIVCRNSGGAAAYAKIEAARDLGLPVIMVRKTADAKNWHRSALCYRSNRPAAKYDQESDDRLTEIRGRADEPRDSQFHLRSIPGRRSFRSLGRRS
jgi:hypothetical protein